MTSLILLKPLMWNEIFLSAAVIGLYQTWLGYLVLIFYVIKYIYFFMLFVWAFLVTNIWIWICLGWLRRNWKFGDQSKILPTLIALFGIRCDLLETTSELHFCVYLLLFGINALLFLFIVNFHLLTSKFWYSRLIIVVQLFLICSVYLCYGGICTVKVYCFSSLLRLIDICRLLLFLVVDASMAVHWLWFLWAVTMRLLMVLGHCYLAISKLILVMQLLLRKSLKVLICHILSLSLSIYIFRVGLRSLSVWTLVHLESYGIGTY